MRIVLLAFKEFPVKGSPFGLSLVVPLWSPPLRAVNFLLVGSPCQTVSLLSSVVLVREDLSMGLVMQLPHAHFQSKRLPVLTNFLV